MEIIRGKSAFAAIAVGKIAVYKKEEQQVRRRPIEEPEREIDRFRKAKEETADQLQKLYERALREVGEAGAMIFKAHQMMLDDGDYQASILHMIQTQKVNAEYAVGTAGDHFANMFAAIDDAYMKERAADVKDISERVIRNLSGKGSRDRDFTEPVIVVADDLAPSETVQLDKDKVLAFVTRRGSVNSHTAILARTMNIPAIINTGIDLEQNLDGKEAVVDGFRGIVYLDPTLEVLEEMKKRLEEERQKKELLQELKGKETVTLDGKKIKLYANIGSVSDIAGVLKNDASGIGLFRSEFLYLEKEDCPTEDEQFAAYKTALENMGGKKVIIRTLDIGADKQVDYFHMEKEENPAMGCRAIRICLERKDIFKTQLRALYRASAFGNLSIMFPMIISVKEVDEILEIVEEVKKELREEEIAMGEAELGIMIETPAAVMVSDELAKKVDFFSIGTNDLTQYTLAIDRGNAKLDRYYDAHHPGVLRMIQMTVESAHKHGIWAGICGELASDLELTETFLAMGVDELSVSPSEILGLRKKIRETKIKP
ncbi:phosphoenolpyruvate--protein phosphotransferase [Lactonifactor longoviformis]|uniref:phosphoenolpyruvate--protein phosphotransferase n=1 Tax=Lactonifactor TaxID=420345 RepID=UPI0012AF0E6D|nr:MULTISPECIES: phosphoenolpyruvate--protein phosphotransferase [Lactonifactor]MCQ4671369.1 phosphoenolpyruvate--protein phosphotransferase [Lactonifactor longoviformis]MSA01230.1 phosphoenolpyruvate--protein phosphotransferase [Lactonifactor sp. BIOML-A5]MSA07396.1 phosphoenolpyruvate--protein phosphotransferase [Lactonifactor sp. BIOML-A4]MSA12126.1 phosphoenolpyruvate--protein phosphotransferase [Lactonifactor sp. BIOML-A3]MSA16566.1 phosphoenolpyruvate--protein phosphotransferase [Lactoni